MDLSASFARPGSETGPGSPARADRLPARILFLLWLGSFIPHLAVVLLFLNYPIALDDMFQYDMLARSLVEGRGYRWYSQADVEKIKPYLQQFLDVSSMKVPPEGLVTTFRAPGYPFFLAGIYALVPEAEHFAAARLAQAGLLALLAPASALIALKLGASRKVAIASGAAMALYPILWFYPAGLASENLFIPLVAFGTLAVLWAAESRSPWRTALAGLILGGAVLTRSVLVPFVLLAALWTWRYGQARFRALVLLAVAFGICLPWAVRNTRIMGRPSFVETGLGYQAYIGYYPGGDGSFVSSIAIPPLTILDDAQRDSYTTRMAIAFIRSDPLSAVGKVFQRAVYFFGLEDRELIYFYSNNFFGAILQPWLTLAYLWVVLPWIGVALLALVGLFHVPDRRAGRLAAALIVGYTLPHLLVIAEPRFHLALVPVMIPLAAIAWSQRREVVSRMLASSNAWAWAVRLSPLLLLALWIWGIGIHWQSLATIFAPGGNHLRWTY